MEIGKKSPFNLLLLPLEVFILIVDKMDWNDLISLSTTSKSLNTLVKKSKPFVDRTTFTLTAENMRSEIHKKFGKFSSVNVESANLLLAREKLHQISRNLVSLKLRGINVVNKLDLFHLLDHISLSQLEDLTIENLKFIDSTSRVPHEHQLKLPRLTNLAISSLDGPTMLTVDSLHNEWILSHLNSITKLESLSVSREITYKIEFDPNPLTNFLNQLDTLNCLDLTFVCLSPCFPDTCQLNFKPTLQLKELKLREMLSDEDDMRPHQALASVFKKGEKLTLLGDCGRDLVIDLFNNCYKTLKYMSIDVGNIVDNHDVSFDSVETLSLCGDVLRNYHDHRGSYDNKLSDFIMKFMYVTHLQMTNFLLNNFYPDIIRLMFGSTKKLTMDVIVQGFDHFFDAFSSKLDELEIVHFGSSQLMTIRLIQVIHVEEFEHLRKIIVHATPADLKAYGNQIFTALHAIFDTAEVFGIFDGKRIHSRSKNEIELVEYGKLLDKHARSKVFRNWCELNLKRLDGFFKHQNKSMENITKVDDYQLEMFMRTDWQKMRNESMNGRR